MVRNIIIIGAGEAGIMLSHEILSSNKLNHEYNIVGFFDDNINKKLDVPIKILGNLNSIKENIEHIKNSGVLIHEIIIAIPSAKQETLLSILNTISDLGIKHKILPGIFEIINGNFSIKDVRNIEPSDLLGREEVGFDEESLVSFYKGKTILVTGGAGSIGSEIVRQVITLPIKKVIALDHNENSLNDLILSQDCEKFDYVVCNVLDYKKMEDILDKHKPNVIFHASANKHLPLMEKYPEEAIKNNILATNRLANIVIEKNIEHFVFVSTDKAVRPTSLMGSSKRISERIILSLQSDKHNTDFKITRFGNVLGSNGSVIPIFKEQIKSGKAITVTHPDMVRFFMSIREAARLVIKSATIKNASIFTLDMGSQVRILDLARNMLALYGLTENDIPIVFTGIREGEKLYEEVLMEDETLVPSEYKKLFQAKDKQKPLTHDERIDMVSCFEAASLEADKEKIKALMRKYIDEYLG